MRAHYKVAADGKSRNWGPGIRERWEPAGTTHAVPIGTERTLCGLALGSLYDFNHIRWDEPALRDKCPRCLAQTRAAS